ncbi:MAG: biosynthetic peptidoglycan transglycosylase, partial [Candidatus Gallimonas sp.]
MKRAIRILSVVLLTALLLLAAAVGTFFAVTANVRLQPEKLALSDSVVKLYDAAGGELPTGGAGCVPFEEMPDYLPNAFVAVEDKRFYSHHGVNFGRMIKAAFKNLVSFSYKEGASTISQQLVKNTHLSGEKTLTRKL